MAVLFPACDLNDIKCYLVFDETEKKYVRCKYNENLNCFVDIYNNENKLSLCSQFMLESDINNNEIFVYETDCDAFG